LQEQQKMLQKQMQQHQWEEQQQMLQQRMLQQQLDQQKLLQQQQLEDQSRLMQHQQQQNILKQREKEMERKNLEKIQMHKLEKERKRSEEERQRREEYDRRQREESQQRQLENLDRRDKERQRQAEGVEGNVFHFPQFSTASTAGQTKDTYAVDSNFIRDLEKNLGVNEKRANLLGPNPPPTPSIKVANIPVLQPPPPTTRPPRTSPLNRSASSLSRHNRSGDSSDGSHRSPEKSTAHVRPFNKAESQGSSAGIGNVRGASANWRPLSTSGAGAGRVDLLAGQRTQLQEFNRGPERSQDAAARLNESFGSSHSGSDTYGTRETYGTQRSTNAMEINKIAQCSKKVPGMSGSEIRAALTAVNWDTSIAVKNLKIDKLYRIGVATKPKCEKVLQAVNWDLEQAASKLLDAL